jgi:hypothetical protein
MKKTLPLFLLLASLGATRLIAEGTSPAAIGGSTNRFFVGQSSFPAGDSIEITSVVQFSDRVVVKGHYNLLSAKDAELGFYITTWRTVSVPTDQTQLKHIFKGEGDFELTHSHLVPGLMHVSMYSLSGGKPFAGVYFGNKEDAAAESKMDLGYAQTGSTPEPSTLATPMSITGPNQALLEYLGNPVEPPVDMDSRYTVPGLTGAIQLAARNAGVTVKNVAIDDSEFPFLVGVVCGGSDFQKLKSQIKKLAGYQYNGSIGNDSNSDGRDTCNAFSMVPDRVYPPGTAGQIYRRLWLRQQVFYDKINQR